MRFYKFYGNVSTYFEDSVDRTAHTNIFPVSNQISGRSLFFQKHLKLHICVIIKHIHMECIAHLDFNRKNYHKF